MSLLCNSFFFFFAPPPAANCADLLAAAEATSEGDIEGQLSAAEITCDGWTTVEVAQNKLKLTTGQQTGAGHTLFTSVRFAVAADAVLRVEVPAEFTGDTTQVQYWYDIIYAYIQ